MFFSDDHIISIDDIYQQQGLINMSNNEDHIILIDILQQYVNNMDVDVDSSNN
jgi:hypothetical protein